MNLKFSSTFFKRLWDWKGQSPSSLAAASEILLFAARPQIKEKEASHEPKVHDVQSRPRMQSSSYLDDARTSFCLQNGGLECSITSTTAPFAKAKLCVLPCKTIHWIVLQRTLRVRSDGFQPFETAHAWLFQTFFCAFLLWGFRSLRRAPKGFALWTPTAF